MSACFKLLYSSWGHHHSFQSSLCHLACEATARDLHLAFSTAALGAVLRVSPLVFRSFLMVCLHVLFSQPFYLSLGVHCSAIMGRGLSVYGRCLSHHQGHGWIVLSILLTPVLFHRSGLGIMSGQKILRMRLIGLFWKTSGLAQ